MVILHPYVKRTPGDGQEATWELLAEAAWSWEYDVRHVLCWSDVDYALALAREVAEGYDVAVVEQDIVPTLEQLEELEGCAHPWCAVDYELAGKGLWSTWADHSCLGLARVRSIAWYDVVATPKVPVVAWGDLAHEVTRRLGPAHLHPGPVAHNHRD